MATAVGSALLMTQEEGVNFAEKVEDIGRSQPEDGAMSYGMSSEGSGRPHTLPLGVPLTWQPLCVSSREKGAMPGALQGP